MKKDRDYITAGAYYRLSKKILADSCFQIEKALNLTAAESDKLFRIYNRWNEIEVNIGFESKAFSDNFDGEVIDLFYGSNSDKAISPTDEQVIEKIKRIISDLIKNEGETDE